MARLETGNRPDEATAEQPDEQLDDWFSRRLDQHGIPRRPGAPSTSRVLAVIGLTLALAAFLWALSSVGSHSSSSGGTTSTTQTPPPTTAGGGTGTKAFVTGPSAWKHVTVDVLNGTSVTGAAASAMAELQARGWKTGQTGNATGITKTEVVYLPGFRAQARVVARKLHLGAPVPMAQAAGVLPSATAGVAVVLGPDQLNGTKP
jgi:hypothetical protein